MSATNHSLTSTCGFLGSHPRISSRPGMTSRACPPSKPSTLYQVLCVKETASPIEIKTAYRILAKGFHPEAVGSDCRDFIEIREAYDTLSDLAARAAYDGARVGSVRFAGAGLRSRRWETDQCWYW